MRILHIVTQSDDRRALAVAERHAAQHAVTVLLLQDGVLQRTGRLRGVRVCACRADVAARGLSSSIALSDMTLLDYDGIVDLIRAHERVWSW